MVEFQTLSTLDGVILFIYFFIYLFFLIDFLNSYFLPGLKSITVLPLHENLNPPGIDFCI